MAGNPEVRRLLVEMLDLDKTPEEVCREYPELLPEVRERWKEFRLVDAQVWALLPEPGALPRTPVNEPGPHTAGPPLIPGYAVEAELGRGGMGVVYKAWHLRLGRPVALKMMLTGAYADPHELARFLREAETVAGLRHANVVQVHEAGDVDGQPYFTMELVEGGSLAQKLAGTPQPARQAAALLATVAEAVHAAHERGIVHRDLKPANILLTAESTPKLTDFGLARRAEGTAGLTQSGTVLGTPSYMAPEQARGQTRAIGPAVDVYALGAVLYECLAGRPPFRAETPQETLLQVINQEPVPPARLNAKVPRDLETICLKCLQKDPGKRYGTAAALAADLGRFLTDEPIQARPTGRVEHVLRWARRRPAATGLLAALLTLFLVTVGGGLWLGRQQAERQGRAREAVEAALAQIPGLRQQSRWPEAQSLLTQASSRLDEAGSDDLRRRLAQAEADLRLAAALEQIRLTPAIGSNPIFHHQGMIEAYIQAFKNAGLDVGGDEEAVAARIRGSDARPQLLMALDHWAFVADLLEDRPLMSRLLGLARRAAPDPDWGDRIREPALWEDRNRLVRLAAEAQQRLAGEPPEAGPPPWLVIVLAKKLAQQGGQAEPLLRAAQWRHPDDFWLNYALAETLREREPAEAVSFYRAALVTRPTFAATHVMLSLALLRQGQHDEAIRAARKSVKLSATLAVAHHILGVCLQAKGELDQAMSEYRRAIELDPKLAAAYYQLGVCWQVRGRIDEAVAEYRAAIQLDPTGGAGHAQLVEALLQSGSLAEAQKALRDGLDVLPATETYRTLLQEQRKRCERMLALEARLPALLRGKERPAAAELLDLAHLCRDCGRPRAAVDLYALAFAARPALADDLEAADRYDAACAAARAAAGEGPDKARLGESDRAGLRRQALLWLRADLALRTRLFEGGKSVDWALRLWQTETALAGVRDPAALAKLPAEERAGWQHLWADAAALRAADPVSQGRMHAARRQWAHAAADYARALKRGPTVDGEVWFEYAALLLLSGDRPGYTQACAHLIEACGKANGPRAYLVARACTLAPEAIQDKSQPGRLAETELRRSAGQFWSLTEQGALHYRAGQFQEAATLFEQSLHAGAKPGQAVLNWLWLALAQQRLGKPEEARRWLGKATAWLDQYPNGMPARAEEELGLHLHNWLEAHVLRSEAEALIQPTGKR